MRTHRKISLVIADGRARVRSIGQLLGRFAIDADGQDLVEYALLTAFIGFVGAAAWNAMRTGLGNAYTAFNTAVWNLWQPADPAGGGS